MAPTIDASGIFDQEAHSDITIKFSGREVKCHKVILCASSEYFNTMLKPDWNFAECRKGVIELKDDDDEPDAVEAMLRYIYSIEYADIAAHLNPDHSNARFHLGVYVVAKKYLLPKLADEAFNAVEDLVRAFRKPCHSFAEHEDTKVLELFLSLSEYREHHLFFPLYVVSLSTSHVHALMAYPQSEHCLTRRGARRFYKLSPTPCNQARRWRSSISRLATIAWRCSFMGTKTSSTTGGAVRVVKTHITRGRLVGSRKDRNDQGCGGYLALDDSDFNYGLLGMSSRKANVVTSKREYRSNE